MGILDHVEKCKELTMTDTLLKIAELWDAGEISDAEAQRRASAIPPVLFERDEDGEYPLGDTENTTVAVYALLSAQRASEFLALVF